MKKIQKVVRTYVPDHGYWYDERKMKYLVDVLNDAYTVVMCNTIHSKNGEEWLEYIVEKEVNENETN